MPAPLLIVGILEIIGPWVLRYFIAKAVFFIAKIFAVVGISLATNEYLMDPLLDHLESKWNAIPPELVTWIQAFGINQVMSILMTAAALMSLNVTVRKVFS